MIKAIALDFDGVLMESVEVKTRAFAELFAGEGPQAVECIVAYHRSHGGVSRFEKFRAIYREILERPLLEPEFRQLCDRFAAIVVDQVVAAPWTEGAEEFLAAVRGRYPLSIVSGTPEGELNEITQRRKIDGQFDGIFGSPRTKEVLLREVMRRHGVQPDELLFVGDSMTDWQAAQQAGVRFVRRRAADDAEAWPGYDGPEVSSLRSLIPLLHRGADAHLRIVSPRDVRRLQRQPSLARARWHYLGGDAAQRQRLARRLQPEPLISIGEELDQAAREIRQPFLDWIADVGLRAEAGNWWASKLASKSPRQTDLFLLCCYLELIERWRREGTLRAVVIEDPWLLQVLRRRYAQEPQVLCVSRAWVPLCQNAVRGLARIPRAAAYFLLWALSLLIAVKRRWPRQRGWASTGASPTVLIYTWIDERSVPSPGVFQAVHTGRLADVLRRTGQQVRYFTPLQVGARRGLLDRLRPFADQVVMSAQYLTVWDVICSAGAQLGAGHLRRAPDFRGAACRLLLLRELVREWSSIEFAGYRLWERAARRLAAQEGAGISCVIYPFENQPWEKLLCLAFRREAPSVRLVGYQHAAVDALWLSYGLGKGEAERAPLPDYVVTNGPWAQEHLARWGIPSSRLINGGAFRYEHLFSLAAEKRNGAATPPRRRVVVALPMMPEPAAQLLRALAEAVREPVECVIKCHPQLPRSRLPAEAPGRCQFSERPLKELLQTADAFVYAPPSTAGWEAYLMGLPVLKYCGGTMDIDSSEALGDGVQRCTDETLRSRLETVLRERAEPDGPSDRRQALHRVFSPVDERVWHTLVKPNAAR